MSVYDNRDGFAYAIIKIYGLSGDVSSVLS